MKNFFLWAVIVSAFCSSCQITDETLSEEINNTVTAKKSQYDDYEVYQNILEHFIYNEELTYEENLKKFEEHTNYLISYYTQKEGTYELIDIEKAKFLAATDGTFVSQMSYSSEMKDTLYSILYLHLDLVPQLQDENENKLIQTLLMIYHEGNGDDKWKKNNKTIAFAYGSQYSFTQAVLYAGAVELSRFQSSGTTKE